MKSLVAALLSAATLSAALPALAQPGDYRQQGGGYGYGVDINGLSVDDAKRQLSSAGYSKARNISVSGQQFDLWSNPRSRDACVGFSSYKGRVTETRSFDGVECGAVSGGWGQGDFPSGLRGMRVDDGKRNLRNYGYAPERNIRSGGQQWDLWYDERGRGDTCVGFTSYNGRVTAVRNFSSRDC